MLSVLGLLSPISHATFGLREATFPLLVVLLEFSSSVIYSPQQGKLGQRALEH